MIRVLPILAGIVVILATGLVHGLWTDRWQLSQELTESVRRLESIPDQLGTWKGEPAELDPKALAMSGAAGSRIRWFTDSRTGSRVLMILLCGKPGPISVHRPEHCYQGAGYEMTVKAKQFALRPLGTKKEAQFWTARFAKADALGTPALRIFWSWLGDVRWRAVSSPRFTFAEYPSLYKLYVIRELHRDPEHLQDDPCVDFLNLLLPALQKSLTPP